MDKTRILILEHDANDLELLQHELRKGGVVCEVAVADNRDPFLTAINNFKPEVILSDYNLPHFDGLSAFALKQEICPETPFIIVSGFIGEENAVELIRSGVTDYVLKEKMYQVAPKVLRAIREVKELNLRKENERKIAEHIRHIESILETITDGFCMVDRDWIIQDWNNAAERIMGIKREEVVGKNLWALYPDACRMRFYQEYTKAMDERIGSSFEEFLPSAGTWFGVNVTPARDGISVFFRDITEQRRQNKLNLLEKEVLELNADNNSSLEKALSHLLEGINEIHPGLRCFFVQADDGRSDKLRLISPPGFHEGGLTRIIQNINEAYKEDNGFLRYKIVITDADTDNLLADERELVQELGLRSCSFYPVFNSAKEFLGIVITCSDRSGVLRNTEEQTIEKAINMLRHIVENKMAEMAIRTSEEIRRLIMDSSLDAIICMDLNGRVTLWNPQAEKMFGWKAKEIIEKDLIMHIVPPPFRSQYHEALRNYIEKGEDKLMKRLAEGVALNQQQKEFPVELTMLPVRQGDNVYFCIFLRDISERKHNEAALMQLHQELKERAEALAVSNAELEQFAFIASHDLQEPLRMISNFLAMLEIKYKNQLDETASQYIHFAVDGAMRLKKLIQDLLLFSRLGRKGIPFENVDTNLLVDEIIHLNQAIIDEKQAMIQKGKLPEVFGSSGLLQQAFQNLILNGLKYHKQNEKPVIRIDATETETFWQFSVKDNGIGIDPKFFEKIFVLFQRLHNKDEYSGTGIGLSVCKKIVEGHKGTIWVESTPGEGSNFFFTISKT